jgi:hypothetical protein
MRNISVPDGTPITENGVLIGAQGIMPPKPGTRLEILYFDVDGKLGLRQAVQSKLGGEWQVWCDSDTGPKLPGSGDRLPAIRYGSAPTGMVITCLNPDHEYFDDLPLANAARVQALVVAAPLVKEAIAAKRAYIVLDYTLDTVWSTLDPQSMWFLLHWGGYGSQAEVDLEVARYATIYYTRWGWQCLIPGSPRNPYASNHALASASDRAIADAYTGTHGL